MSIFRVRAGDSNVIFETLTHRRARYPMCQRYLPEIREGDKRVLLIDGEPVDYALARVPAGGDARGNLAAGWTSTGAHEDGTPFLRPGRCTVTLRRADPTSPWLGTHTHFSLNRGTPAVSHRGTSGPEASS